MYAPTASADSGPRFWDLDAVPKITLNNPTVRISSITIAWTSLIPAPGSVAPSDPTLPNIAQSNSTAKVEPSSSAMMYPGTRRHGKSPRRAKPRVTAGFRWAPLTAPMNRMIASTIRPGAVTLAPRPMAPSLTASTTPPPAPTRTKKKVPRTAANNRRHSCLGSSKLLLMSSSSDRPLPTSRNSAPTLPDRLSDPSAMSTPLGAVTAPSDSSRPPTASSQQDKQGRSRQGMVMALADWSLAGHPQSSAASQIEDRGHWRGNAARASVARSVLEGPLPKSRFKQHGERVVSGQRMMQAASDIFLGWTKGVDATRYFYWRQLRDMKGSAEVESMAPVALSFYARTCGWTLARAHARSGDPVAIAQYLGEDDNFDQSITDFAKRYADQNELDYQAFADAIRSGRLEALEG